MSNDTAWDDADRLRRRQAGLDDDAQVAPGLESRPSCVVAKVVSGTGAGNLFFTLEIQAVTGTEADGSAGVLTGTGVNIKAVNLGSAAAPPVGTALICHRTSYRWAFRYG